MATETHNSWVEYDIAIEVIGKMIAEQIELQNELINSFKRLGIGSEDQLLLTDRSYINCMEQIRKFRAEINSIYTDKDIKALLHKVREVYAPYIKARMRLDAIYTTTHAQPELLPVS